MMSPRIFIAALPSIVMLAFGNPAFGATQFGATSGVVTTGSVSADGGDPAEWSSPPKDILAGSDAEGVQTVAVDTCYGAGCNDKGPVATGCADYATTARTGSFSALLGTVKVELRYSRPCNAFWVRASSSGACDHYTLKIRNSPTASTSDIRVSLSQTLYGEPEWSNMVSGAGRWVQSNVGCYAYGGYDWSGWSGWSYGAD